MDKICNFDIVINTCLAEMNLTPLDDVLDKLNQAFLFLTLVRSASH